MMTYYAHTAEDADGKPLPESSGKWQPLSAHLRNVAELAKRFAAAFKASDDAELAGVLHDVGKYAERFQARLRRPSAIRGVNHWAAGAYVGRLWPHVSFAIDGHHTGLPAFQNGDAGESLQQTLRKFQDSTTRADLTGQCREDADTLLRLLASDGLHFPNPETATTAWRDFAGALRTRMLFSCLVDADFLDTETHFSPEAGRTRAVPVLDAERALAILRTHLDSFRSDGALNQLRRQLLSDCLRMAEHPPGLFTLTAPTGSGKTLASLAFALRHIVHHNANLSPDNPRCFRRVIVVIPYTSIIEQTARVYRELFEPAFGPDYVLEHHSAVAPRERDSDRGRDAEEERLRRARLAAENWSSPLVVTTSVQFFESLFANRPADCRKLHNIARSVVLFDEVQTLPPRLAPSLLSAVRLLTQEPYGVTAVFMTATQPAFASARHALPFGWDPISIESDSNALAETLRRTRIQLPVRDEAITWSNMARQLTAQSQALCVVNTTKDARALFRLVRQSAPDAAFHLSARMCPAHRLEKLAEIRRRLSPDRGEPCVLVSTQLIEAGVDVDFPIAFRALGPLDSIIQTAGRCNREGRHAERCPVSVFRPAEGGALPSGYEQVMRITEAFLHGVDPEMLHLPETYSRYFSMLYSLRGPEKADADRVFAFSEKFDFPAAAAACRLVDTNTRSVLVRWGAGDTLINKLRNEKHLSAGEWRSAQRFSISLHEGEFIDARSRGFIAPALEDLDKWYWTSNYGPDLGACHAEGGDFCL
jgi:CRISPR-associated endonuclease/helicase Cas3